jgi:hypothetical protein
LENGRTGNNLNYANYNHNRGRSQAITSFALARANSNLLNNGAGNNPTISGFN